MSECGRLPKRRAAGGAHATAGSPDCDARAELRQAPYAAVPPSPRAASAGRAQLDAQRRLGDTDGRPPTPRLHARMTGWMDGWMDGCDGWLCGRGAKDGRGGERRRNERTSERANERTSE
eukprot:scaffold4987_cov363-Prasinococcus_capsulatus_cf.AAC.7